MSEQTPLDSFLSAGRQDHRVRCKVCSTPVVRDTIVEFLDKVVNGDPAVAGLTINYIVEKMLVQRMGIAITKDTCYRHVARCLRRDMKTGQPLENA